MVQQQQAYVAATSEWPQQSQQLQVLSNGIQAIATAANTTLAMPAIVGSANQQQAQYSPQDTNGSNGSIQNGNYYQQQLIKSAQQQFAVQQQRMNGISNGESLYNGVSPAVSRPAPIYAPKPTYYSQQQQQQQQPLYQQTRAFYTPQQQHSPASLLPQQSNGQLAATGLSVRQLPTINNTNLVHQQQQNSPQQVQSPDQRNQHMQQLIMSYQQQQQPYNQQQPAIPNFAHNYNGTAMNTLVKGDQLQPDSRQRSLIEEQHRLIQQQHLRHSARNARFSDHDSVSTVSRFNQLDDRRSFTMRSQYTSANNAVKYSKKFGFIELTGEALKRVLGLTGNSCAGDSNRGSDGEQRKSNNLIIPSSASSSQHPSSAAKITCIDSGEDYYFKRKVFKYQLVILRAISFLCATFVLLSPVAMLLIPKLESVLHSQSEIGAVSSSASETASVSSQPQQSTPSVAIVTHGVGLSGANKQVNYIIPQPQWRISECTSDCDGPLIGFFARFIMLCIAYWAIFFRAQTSSLPRIDFHRCLLISMAILLTLAYWLFFIFRVFDKRYNDFELQYMTIVQFALSMLESLILLHYLAVLLLQLRERKRVYCLKVVRSPDGASQYLSCGSLSIQKCAQYVLEKYHREFKNFSSYQEHLLELEDDLAKNLSSASRDKGGDKSPLTGRSRANSPANSTIRGSRLHQSTSRPSRHHARHRSPSRSPVRSSRGGNSRSQKKSAPPETVEQQTSSSQVKVYPVDVVAPVENQTESATTDHNNSQNQNDNRNSTAENDSADQSSDTTSRMKESSLETIRAANSTSELLNSQQQSNTASAKQRSSSRVHLESHEEQRDETESVRSVRSRRSTSRSQNRHREHHHHHHHRERSSSRHEQLNSSSHDDRRRSSNVVSIPLNSSDNPLEEHERKLRRRKYRLLMAVQDTFEQIRQLDEAQI